MSPKSHKSTSISTFSKLSLGFFLLVFIPRFILALVEDPAGMLAWGLIATLLFPLTLLMYVEAGRYGAKGLLRWPILVPGMATVPGENVDIFDDPPLMGKLTISNFYGHISVVMLDYQKGTNFLARFPANSKHVFPCMHFN